MRGAYVLFHECELVGCQSIGLGNDRNDVHFVMQCLHAFDIQWFEAEERNGVQAKGGEVN